jgi:hypothetical protein
MPRKKKQKKTFTPICQKKWLVYRAKGAVTIFENDAMAEFSADTKQKGLRALNALVAFIDSAKTEHE